MDEPACCSKPACIPLPPFCLWSKGIRTEYQALVAAAKRYATDPSIGVAFVHLNVPHMPYLDKPGIGHLLHSVPRTTLYVDEFEWVDNAVAGNTVCPERLRHGIQDRSHPQFGPSGASGIETHALCSFHRAFAGIQCRSGCRNRGVFGARSADLFMAIAGGQVRSPPDIENSLCAGNVKQCRSGVFTGWFAYLKRCLIGSERLCHENTVDTLRIALFSSPPPATRPRR